MTVLENIPLTPKTSYEKSLQHFHTRDEADCIQDLFHYVESIPQAKWVAASEQAEALVREVRQKEGSQRSVFDQFLTYYHLSSEEGIALMCLAEAMLRVPDKETIYALIQDKLSRPHWQGNLMEESKHSLFINATSWSLMLTGKLLSENKLEESKLTQTLKSLFMRISRPVIRQAVSEIMKLLGKHFVMGDTIESAKKRAKALESEGFRYSYDMLGEAAKTEADAARYFEAYREAILSLACSEASKSYLDRPGISIKLSALYPRYEFAKASLAVPILTEKLLSLVIEAKNSHITVTVDAEEAFRLDMSLAIIESVFAHESLEGWEGFGLAVQAYQKRAMPLIDWLIDRAKHYKRRWMVRLVKGAYWDTEIKEAQILGLDSYPVFTRKSSTDLSYIACAKKMIEAPEFIYSQFATHNAYSVAVILHLLEDKDQAMEFQCLHGMGRALYESIQRVTGFKVPCRIYAPVGSYNELLPYLVRRLLENGANTSFVNQIRNEKAAVQDLLVNPLQKLKKLKMKSHPNIPLPIDLYGKARKNSKGLDLSRSDTLTLLKANFKKLEARTWEVTPLPLSHKGSHADVSNTSEVISPNDLSVIGKVTQASVSQVDWAVKTAYKAQKLWNAMPVSDRCEILMKAADLIEEQVSLFYYLLIKEAGKTLSHAIAEVREAVDFCRYYASQATEVLSIKNLPGPTGELNQMMLEGRGVLLCISPWNFPLAIFTGQIAASLVAGNAVIAKPATQTPIIASEMVKLFYQAGIPQEVLHLLPGSSEVVGKPLVVDPNIDGILVTGSTQTAQHINRALASRPGAITPLIAETGGQNVLIADTTALPEQLVTDVIESAFGSAGQRCSALRVLFLQREHADAIITMLQGAMAALTVGNTCKLETDIGPVIDEAARLSLLNHVDYLDEIGANCLCQVKDPENNTGCFFPPRVYEIQHINQLKEEVFGPILHIIRYERKDIDQVIDDINATGFGLTMGIQSRIETFVDYICQRVKVGNIYVNRNIVGAVVGTQPFGGEGLSGTGPKAGGPYYLPRLCKEKTLTVNTSAAGGNISLLMLKDE